MNVFYALFLSLLLLGSDAYSQELARIRPGQPIALDGQLETFTDSTQRLTLAQVSRLYSQHRLPYNRLLENYTTANHWLYLRIPPANDRLLYLEIITVQQL